MRRILLLSMFALVACDPTPRTCVTVAECGPREACTAGRCQPLDASLPDARTLGSDAATDAATDAFGDAPATATLAITSPSDGASAAGSHWVFSAMATGTQPVRVTYMLAGAYTGTYPVMGAAPWTYEDEWPEGDYTLYAEGAYADGTTLRSATIAFHRTGTTTGVISELNPNRLVIALTGNDTTGDGSDAAPFATLTRAMQAWNAASAPRPWIYFRAGTYGGQTISSWVSQVTVAPTATSPLIIRNWPSETVVLEGVSGNFATPRGPTASYFWIHGLTFHDWDDPSGNGAMSTILEAPGPWRYTGNRGLELGTRIADAKGGYTDHMIYLGHEANISGLPCLIGGNSLLWETTSDLGAMVHAYTGDPTGTANAVEVAYNEAIGGSWGVLAGGADGWTIHHNSFSGQGRPVGGGGGIDIGSYTADASVGAEVHHNIVRADSSPCIVQAASASGTRIHDNWFFAPGRVSSLSGDFAWAASNVPSTATGASAADPMFVDWTSDLHLAPASPVPADYGAHAASRASQPNIVYGPHLTDGVFTW